MDQIDLTLKSIFHEDTDFSSKPQIEVDHYVRGITNLDVGQQTRRRRNNSLIESIIAGSNISHSRSSLLFRWDRGVDWHTAYAIILGKFPPGYISEWEEDDKCHRCGESFNSPQNLGRSMLCWPCDIEMDFAFDGKHSFNPLGQSYAGN